mmetsp:Transcript_21813/g.53878  ORF Transcript_21813/g.53878 Transcript_21813/m.53878 type:complete len:161 (+) Transcript_21813:383-865(+)
MIETKIRVEDWDTRVNLPIFAMIVVDAWLLFKGCREPPRGFRDGEQRRFYICLEEQLIDNKIDAIPASVTRRSKGEEPTSTIAPLLTVPADIFSVRTYKRKRAGKSKHTYQGYCKCGLRPTDVCSECRRLQHGEFFVCLHGEDGSFCFAQHVRDFHVVHA